MTFAEVRAGAVAVELEGRRLLIIGLRKLRRNKKATGRSKDKQDLRLLPRADPAG